MIARIASYFIGMAIATSAFAADVVADDAWINIPAGATNGNVPLMVGNCLIKKGTPTVMRSGVHLYAPEKLTYGSECPAGIPVDSGPITVDTRPGLQISNHGILRDDDADARVPAFTGGSNVTVDTRGITVPPTGDISSTPRDPSRCVFEIDGSSTIIGVHPVPCHINIPAPQDIVIEARPNPLDALKLNNSQFVH